MAAKRGLAALLAIALVVGAVLVRRVLDGETVVPVTRPVICDRALADACRATYDNVTLEDPGATLDRLLASPGEVVWVTDQVWLEILAAESNRAGRSIEIDVSDPLATTNIVLVARADVGEGCGGALTWACATETDVELGLDPADSTVGLLTRGELVASFFEDPAFASNDLNSTYNGWRRTVDRAITDRLAQPSVDILFTRPGTIDAAATTKARFDQLGRTDFVAVSPGGRSLRAVVAGIDGASPQGERALGDQLRDRFWEIPAANSDQLPSAGVLQALREDW